MATAEAKTSPNVHLSISISLPAPLRARIDAEAAERQCTRASLVLAALDRRYGTGSGELDDYRPTGVAHRERILRFAETKGAITYADAAGATGLEYWSARRYVLQLADAGLLAADPAGKPLRFRLAVGAEK